MPKLLAECGIEKDYVGPSNISLILFIMAIFSIYCLILILICMYLLNFQSTEVVVVH